MNRFFKTQYFNWLLASTLVPLAVLGVALNGRGSSDQQQQRIWKNAHVEARRATEAWEANSFVPEPRPLREPVVKLSPMPPLPNDAEGFEIKPLPQTGLAHEQNKMQPLEAETEPAEIKFSSLPSLQKPDLSTAGSAGLQDKPWKIRALPPRDEIKFKALPAPVSDQSRVAPSANTDPGNDGQMPKARQLSPKKAASAWVHPNKDAVIQLASAELELKGPNEPNTILGIPADSEPVAKEPPVVVEPPVAVEPLTLVAKLPKALLEKKPKKKKKAVVAAPKKGSSPKSASKKDKDDYKLAAQPKMGAHYVEDKPQTDQNAHLIEPLISDFSPDATNPYLPYEPHSQMNVYQGKTLNANQRPLVELGRPWYQLGQLSPGSSVLGFHNNVNPQFLVFGDYRTGYASNRSNGNSTSQIATQLNLDFDLKLTGTERFHAFVQPLSSNGRNTRRLLDDDEFEFEGSANPLFGYFEGDLGALVGGAIGKTLPFDLPFTAGVIPLVFQNGVWFEDAILGFAATLPAKNSPRFNISNMDFTFFAGYDKLVSPAFPGDDSAARIIGMASFLEMLNGYIEIDYAFLDDRTFDDRSYHNIGIGYTRRYGRFLSNSTRVIVNAGQNSAVVDNTADGVLLLSENSLITGFPSNIVPYFNFFAGFDRPQSAARAAAAGGVLRNTGILFESDNLTGYPTLDATANDTFGMALGLEVLSGGDRFSQQLVLEAAALGVMGNDATRNAAGDQYGVGFRYQLPLSNSVILRADGMYGFLRNDEDISGIRLEIRKKF